MAGKLSSDKQFEKGRQSRQGAAGDLVEYEEWWENETVERIAPKRQEPQLWELFLEIFPDDATIDKAASLIPFIPIKQQDAAVLKLMRTNLDDSGRLNVAKISRGTGLSRRTVQRRIKYLLELFLVEKRPAPVSGIIAVKFKGKRSPRYYFQDVTSFGKRYVVTKASINRPPRKDIQVEATQSRHYHRSSMRDLFGWLITELANLPKPKPSEWPPRELASDWKYNVAKAREMTSKRAGQGPWTADDVYYALGKGSRECKSCRGRIIPGLRFKGHLITRGKEYCDKACAMRNRRGSL